MIRKDEIERDINYLEDSLNKVRRELDSLKKKVPEGARLRAIKHGKTFQYYLRTQEYGSNGKYISKSNRNLAELLAQIEYDNKLEKLLKENIDNLKDLQEIKEESPFQSAIDQMVLGKRELIKEHYISDEAYMLNWLSQEYDKLEFRYGYPEYFTRRGMRVRSKSEVIIADMLDELAVPFLYEKPLKLGMTTVHPDFTLLNIYEKKELYWEHFGMMDDIEYRNNAFSKIQRYELYGYYQYSSVIWTFETSVIPLNTRSIRKMIIDLRKSLGYENS